MVLCHKIQIHRGSSCVRRPGNHLQDVSKEEVSQNVQRNFYRDYFGILDCYVYGMDGSKIDIGRWMDKKRWTNG